MFVRKPFTAKLAAFLIKQINLNYIYITCATVLV
ncbi:MAG: hypothetical protein ACI9LN_003689 [Saprospiraceae bacterium]|jgi:hypothetical protein